MQQSDVSKTLNWQMSCWTWCDDVLTTEIKSFFLLPLSLVLCLTASLKSDPERLTEAPRSNWTGKMHSVVSQTSSSQTSEPVLGAPSEYAVRNLALKTERSEGGSGASRNGFTLTIEATEQTRIILVSFLRTETDKDRKHTNRTAPHSVSQVWTSSVSQLLVLACI